MNEEIFKPATRFFDFNSVWINQLEKAMVSDLEWTTEHERIMEELGPRKMRKYEVIVILFLIWVDSPQQWCMNGQSTP